MGAGRFAVKQDFDTGSSLAMLRKQTIPSLSSQLWGTEFGEVRPSRIALKPDQGSSPILAAEGNATPMGIARNTPDSSPGGPHCVSARSRRIFIPRACCRGIV